tara:strand:+ start:535 stop:723 length:189 start_codon:yes stop_codon:yes gene_type:complete
MKNLIKHQAGYYELITGTNVSYMIEHNEQGFYNVTMLEDDEAVDDVGVFDDIRSAVTYLKSA